MSELGTKNSIQLCHIVVETQLSEPSPVTLQNAHQQEAGHGSRAGSGAQAFTSKICMLSLLSSMPACWILIWFISTDWTSNCSALHVVVQMMQVTFWWEDQPWRKHRRGPLAHWGYKYHEYWGVGRRTQQYRGVGLQNSWRGLVINRLTVYTPSKHI